MKTVRKIWGSETWLVNNELYCFKKLYLKKGYQCSLHKHKIKDETFVLKEGKVLLEYGSMKKRKTIEMEISKEVRINPNVYHKFIGLEHSVIFEVSTTHFEIDSYRLTESGKVEDV